MTDSTQLIDVSHTIESGLVTYRGLPAPIICDYLSREESRTHYAPGTEFQIGKIEMVANTGTYVDSPFHRFADGKDLSQLPLTSLANIPGIVVEAKTHAIDATTFRSFDVAGKAVLVKTGWSVHWKTDNYFEGHPFLTEDAAIFLRDAGATLVGIDSLNIDDTNDGRRPVHSTFAGCRVTNRRASYAARQTSRPGISLFCSTREGQIFRDISRSCIWRRRMTTYPFEFLYRMASSSQCE